MEIFPLVFPDPEDRLKSLLSFAGKNGDSLEVGTAFLPAGCRMPDRGTSTYDRREISFILEGELETTTGPKTTILRAGDIVTIAPGEEQFSRVLKDTRLIYLFFST